MRETNRVLKFRALVQDSNKSPFYMVQASSLTWDIGRIGYIVNENFCIPPEHLMQFTGLHDRNGKEIWEGDILSTPVGNQVVYYTDNGFYYDWDKKGYQLMGVGDFPKDEEVIGNIFEHPELLEEEP